MKVINISDIHADFETFDKASEFIKASDAEVLAINGDLAGSVFEGQEKLYLAKLTGILRNIVLEIHKATNGHITTLHDAAENLVSGRIKTQGQLKKLAEDYLCLEEKVKEKLLNQYQEFKQRFDDLEQKVILVPGNWDGKCIDDVLAHENLHLRDPLQNGEYNGLKFVGYGGAPLHPVELPIDLTIEFSDDEAYVHLCKYEDAKVALTHASPRFEFNRRHLGQYSLLAYLFKIRPALLLIGDIHIPFVTKEPKTRTVIANPGNLGRYQNESFGSFLELEIDNDYFVKPIAFHTVKGHFIQTSKIEADIFQNQEHDSSN